MKRYLPFLGGVAAILLLIVALGASSIGPWPITGTLPVAQQGYGITGAGSLTLASTGNTGYYLSSGGTTATSVACNSILLSVSGGTSGTTTATLVSSSGTGGVVIPTGTVLTLSASNLNALKFSGSNAVIGYVYSN